MPGRYILLIITVLAIALMLITFFTDAVSAPLSYIADYTIIPVEKGLNSIGVRFSEKVEEINALKGVQAENEELKKHVKSISGARCAAIRANSPVPVPMSSP